MRVALGASAVFALSLVQPGAAGTARELRPSLAEFGVDANAIRRYAYVMKTRFSRRLGSVLTVFLTAGSLACSKEQTTPPAPDTAKTAAAAKADNKPAAASPAKADESGEAAPPDLVTVSSAGTEFDPPVKLEQIPDGVWICDMGTVHYARSEKGDGKCAVCSMDMTQKVAGSAEPHGN